MTVKLNCNRYEYVFISLVCLVYEVVVYFLKHKIVFSFLIGHTKLGKVPKFGDVNCFEYPVADSQQFDLKGLTQMGIHSETCFRRGRGANCT